MNASRALARASAIRRYKRHYGHDAVMQWRVHERRRKARLAAVSAASVASGPGAMVTPLEGTGPKVPHCTHSSVTTGHCQSVCLPATKYCRQHICSDGSQCLFVPCEQALATGQRCGQPVPAYIDLKRCFLHIELKPVRCELSDVDELREKWSEARAEAEAQKSSHSRGAAPTSSVGVSVASSVMSSSPASTPVTSTVSVAPKDGKSAQATTGKAPRGRPPSKSSSKASAVSLRSSPIKAPRAALDSTAQAIEPSSKKDAGG